MKLKDIKVTNEYRSKLFWSWNGRLEDSELLRQIDEFLDHGVGGFFMHSREGLETEYMSDEWLRLSKICANKASQKNLAAYLYDEDKWPSGMAAGLVTKEHPEFVAKAIVLKVGEHDCTHTYKADINGDVISFLGSGTETIGIDVEISGGHDWYNGNAPADNLDVDSVGAFINMTHEKYKGYYGDEFANLINGIFSDEPNFCDFFANYSKGKPWLPWTTRLPEYFKQRRGYDILQKLPLLFFRGDGCEKVRHDYWRTLTELFSESYARQLGEWCEKNGIELCGHELFENSLGYQTRVCGAVMPQLRYYHMPGIDILGEQTEEYLTVKQCVSVARQMGRRTISETYGCTGWQFTFEGQKRLWDWQSVMGINIRSQHLAQYSIKGLRKRDYPPIFSYQSDSYRYAKVIEDYCATVSAYGMAGEAVCDILVVHPISGTWTKSGSTPFEDLSKLDSNMGWTCENILSLNAEGEPFRLFLEGMVKSGIDFDLGDEIMLADMSYVEKGLLHLGKAKYRTVIVPKTASIFASTLELLQKLIKDGGKVIFVGGYPQMIEGMSKCVEVTGAKHVSDYGDAIAGLKPMRQVVFSDIHTLTDAPIMQNLRKLNDGHILMAVNNENRPLSCIVKTKLLGYATLIDVLTGKRNPISIDSKGQFLLDFTPYDLKLIEFDEKKEHLIENICLPFCDPHQTMSYITCFGPTAHFTRTMENALVIDKCRARTDTFTTDSMQVWQVQRELRKRFGFMQVYKNGMPMRYTWINSDKRTFTVELEFSFLLKDMPKGDLYLVLEDAERYTVSCNGLACETMDDWYLDRAMKKVKLCGTKHGENIILISCDYSCDFELEDVYIVGDFAIDLDGQIIHEPEKLHFGNWCFQGYPNYPGSMVYHFMVKTNAQKAKLLLGEWYGVLATVSVNGKKQFIPWQAANPLDITLKDGENRINIEIVGSNRNLFGPFHNRYVGRSRISWEDFRTEGIDFTEDRVLLPYGLMGQVMILKQSVNKHEGTSFTPDQQKG